MSKRKPPELSRPVAARTRGAGQHLKGLGTRLVLAQVLVASLLVCISWFSHARSKEAEERLLAVYDHRVLPLHRLGQLTDTFAIDFVDTVHKVSDGSLPASEGARRLERVRRDAERVWHDSERVMHGSNEAVTLETLRPLLAEARASLSQAQALMLAGDREGLAAYRRTELYAHVDPLTERLHAQVVAAIALAHAELTALQLDLRRTALHSALGLGFAGLLALCAGAFVAIRFVASLRRIERVVESAASGDLSQRIELAGSDELAIMAGRIDEMISAIQQSQEAEARQARVLARAEAEARAASAAKSAFLGNVSHELRTPLNVILGYVQALDREPQLQEEVRHGLSRIAEAGKHLLQLIDDVISVARLDAGGLVVRPTPFSPSQLLSELESMLKGRASAKSLVLETLVVGTVPATVTADRRRLLQVLLNLVGNAVKFTAQGKVQLRLSWQDERLRFQVSDTGPGISEAERKTLFQAFSQGDLGQRSGEGTGLGLHISRELARSMGGDITLESKPAHGSTFTCEVVAPETLSPPELAREPRRVRAVDAHGLAPMLVVDDRAANREVLCALLRVTGFEAVEAGSGEAALSYLETAQPSLVWIDLKMPGIDGIEVIRRLRTHEAEQGLPRVPVVVVTASVFDLDRKKAQELGFDEMLPKPFSAESILDTIQRLTHVELVADTVSSGPGGEARPSPPQAFDVTTLSGPQRARLRDLLTLGDIAGAAAVARELGPEAAPLVAEIISFRTDALLAKLR